MDNLIVGVVGFIAFSLIYWLVIKLISYVFKVEIKRAVKYVSITTLIIFGIFMLTVVLPPIIKRLNNPKIENSKTGQLIKIGPAPKFLLTNQDNKQVSNATYNGKVYVLEFFFSTCPTICPKMNANLKTVQDEFMGNNNFGIASITINPATDTAEVLKKHAEELGVKSTNWHFLTGDKDYIYEIANKGFNMYAGENAKANGGFEHSGMFALIDKNGNIRCREDEFGNPILYYDGLEEKGIKALKEDIKLLLEE